MRPTAGFGASRTLDQLSQRFAEVRILRSYLDAVHGASRCQWRYWPESMTIVWPVMVSVRHRETAKPPQSSCRRAFSAATGWRARARSDAGRGWRCCGAWTVPLMSADGVEHDYRDL